MKTGETVARNENYGLVIGGTAPCCERDIDSDGHCDVHPKGSGPGSAGDRKANTVLFGLLAMHGSQVEAELGAIAQVLLASDERSGRAKMAALAVRGVKLGSLESLRFCAKEADEIAGQERARADAAEAALSRLRIESAAAIAEAKQAQARAEMQVDGLKGQLRSLNAARGSWMRRAREAEGKAKAKKKKKTGRG